MKKMMMKPFYASWFASPLPTRSFSGSPASIRLGGGGGGTPCATCACVSLFFFSFSTYFLFLLSLPHHIGTRFSILCWVHLCRALLLRTCRSQKSSEVHNPLPLLCS